MSTVAPEQTGFELERFQWSEDDRLEVEGRWFGVRGRRFVRPMLTVQVAGRRRRLLALLEHKPWTADEGESWIAAFPWEGTHDDVGEGELEVGALTVDLPPPGGARRPRRRPEPAAAEAAVATPAEPAEAVAPPEPEGDPVLRVAGETRQQLERDLAGARAELARLRARHEQELRDARSEARAAADRVAALEARAAESGRRAEQLAGEAEHLRRELDRLREGQGDQLSRMGASEAEARAEAARERERAAAEAGEAERLRAAEAGAAAEAERLAAERRSAESELVELREANDAAQAEISKLRQAARRSAGEAERLRAASRRPGGRLPEPPPARLADPEATVPFHAIPEAEEQAPEPRPKPPGPSKPGPAVRIIPRERPAAPESEAVSEPEREPEPPVGAVQAPSLRKKPGTGAARLLGEDAIVPLEDRSTLAVWGPRVAAVLLVALLLLALALIVRGIV